MWALGHLMDGPCRPKGWVSTPHGAQNWKSNERPALATLVFSAVDQLQSESPGARDHMGTRGAAAGKQGMGLEPHPPLPAAAPENPRARWCLSPDRQTDAGRGQRLARSRLASGAPLLRLAHSTAPPRLPSEDAAVPRSGEHPPRGPFPRLP